MRIRLLGTRGSLPRAGPETVRYGGNTSCVEVLADEGSALVLDAGTGILTLDPRPADATGRVHVLLTHLHMDHLQGLGFFRPLYNPAREVHIWGPPSTTRGLHARLTQYLSPPLFPVLLRDLPCRLFLHDIPLEPFALGGFRIDADLVSHPGPTVGYRITDGSGTLAYIPDHEPALGVEHFPGSPAWTSGYAVAAGVDVLIHDAQFTREEYAARIGWGHSAIEDAVAFARLAGVRRLVTFHHDPSHDDEALDRLIEAIPDRERLPFELIAGREGLALDVGGGAS